jgi:hypothetical protein
MKQHEIHLRKEKYIICIIIYYIVILGNIIQPIIPLYNLYDELVAIFLLIFYAKNFKFLSKNDKWTLYPILIMLFEGFLCTLINRIQTDIVLIIKDCILYSKFFIGITLAKFLFPYLNKDILVKSVQKPTKFLITIIFICSIINLIIDIHMGGEIRNGFRSFQFLYGHYTYLVASMVIMMSITLYKNNFFNKYNLFGCFILLTTLRSKAIIFVLVYIIIGICRKYSIKLKLRSYILMAITSLWIMSDKISDYISWGVYNLRTGLYVVGFLIAMNHFPLGTGFCTFGSNLSFLERSPLYAEYGLNNSQAMGDNQEGAFISDTFWPYIYGQWGIIGLILYVTSIIFIFKSLKQYENNENYYYPSLLLILYLLIGSFAEATFTNETGIFTALIINIFFYNSNDTKQNNLCRHVRHS